MARILVANKFYYPRGGDCIYAMGLNGLLQSHGHETAVFAMRHPETVRTEWEGYFPSEVRFSFGTGLLKAVLRLFGTDEVKRKFNALADKFRPDIVHLNNIHSQLSPVIAEAAHRRGIRVVWTLHDYKLLCPRYDCLRDGRTACEECFADKKNVLRHKCMKNSLLASFIAYKEAVCWSRERIEACTDAFICPSRFMAAKMEKGGFDKRKLHVLCNFMDADRCGGNPYEKEDWYCYVGRLSPEKGIRTLIEAANRLPYRLVVIGDGPLRKELEAVGKPHIEFAGFLPWDEIKERMGKARFCVLPSEWYENSPFSVIEAQCMGTPVLVAEAGGIPEIVEEGADGLLFESRNADDLREKIEKMFTMEFDYKALADRARARFSPERYYECLMRIYDL